VSRDYEPQTGQWYEDLDTEETFQVLSVDPDEEVIRIQWPDREVQELDLDSWNEMDLELATAPEGWADDEEDIEADEDEDVIAPVDVEDEDEEDDEDDDWDDDEDDDDDDWDDDEDDDLDDDDEYSDRE
jgi:hypothetical protein